MAPRDFPDDDDDGDHSQPDAHDDADLGFDAGPPAGALDPLAAFLKELEDLDSMSGPDIMAAIADLPVPQEGFVAGMSAQDTCSICAPWTSMQRMPKPKDSWWMKLIPGSQGCHGVTI